MIDESAAPRDRDAWQPIETMPEGQQVLVSDGALVKPGVRVSADVVAAPILMALALWTHWRPFPPPPTAASRVERRSRRNPDAPR